MDGQTDFEEFDLVDRVIPRSVNGDLEIDYGLFEMDI